MRVKLKGINRVSKRLADGKRAVYYYAWKGGPRLRGQPGSEQFIASYNEAVALRRRGPEGTVLGLSRSFRQSEEFRGLAPRTRSDYASKLSSIEANFGDLELEALVDRRTRGIFLDWRDRLAKSSRRQADYAWVVLARLLSWGLNRGKIAVNPCEKAGRLYRGSRAKKSGAKTTRRHSSKRLRDICTCRYCWRCGPASDKVIFCDCLGRPMTARTSGSANRKPAAA